MTITARDVRSTVVNVRFDGAPSQLASGRFQDLVTTAFLVPELCVFFARAQIATRVEAMPELTAIRASYGSPFVIDFLAAASISTLVVSGATSLALVTTYVTKSLVNISQVRLNEAERRKALAEVDILVEERKALVLKRQNAKAALRGSGVALAPLPEPLKEIDQRRSQIGKEITKLTRIARDAKVLSPEAKMMAVSEGLRKMLDQEDNLRQDQRRLLQWLTSPSVSKKAKDRIYKQILAVTESKAAFSVRQE